MLIMLMKCRQQYYYFYVFNLTATGNIQPGSMYYNESKYNSLCASNVKRDIRY